MPGVIWTPLPLIHGSQLHRVDININFSFCYETYEVNLELEDFNEDKVLKAALDGLPLLRTKCNPFAKIALGE